MKISCVMITAHRREFIPVALRCFMKQTWPDRELVVYDNGDDSVRDCFPDAGDLIRYFRRPPFRGEASVGVLRNCANDVTRGDLIAHWDDDDWSFPGRLEHQVELLRGRRGARIAGYDSMLFFTEGRGGSLHKYSTDEPNYALGTSLLYERSLWKERPFQNKDVGEDNAFLEDQDVATASAIEPEIRMVARSHDRGTSTRRIVGDTWSRMEEPELLGKVKELFT